MPLTLTEDDYGSVANSQFFAEAVDNAYLPEAEGAAKFLAELGLTAKLLSVNNTQAYVGTNDDNIVVVFRGSEGPNTLDGLKDWFVTNALNLLIQPTGPLAEEFLAAGTGARWHQGFVNAITDIWPPLFAEVTAKKKEKERCFWICGHSLGGALGLLAGWLFYRNTMMPHQIYTFGGPMVGNQAVADAINREFAGKIFRYVNGPDPVPLLPMMSLAANEFVHNDKAVSVGPASEAANLVGYMQSAAGGMVEGLYSGDIQGKVWGAVMARVNAHLMPDYRKGLG